MSNIFTSRGSFAAESLSLGGGGGGGLGRTRGRSLWIGSAHGGAGGSGVRTSQASQPLLFGASKGGVGGGYSSSLDLGSALGVGVGSGLGVSLSSGFGAKSAAGFGAGFRSGGGFGTGAAFTVGAASGGGSGGADVGILGNEKFALRILNDRLASYLKKVHLLEKANAELELKISQFVESRTTPTARDYSDSLTTITELQTNILDAILVKGAVQLNIDNATLAADDFRIKYENELALRQAVEADIAGLKRLLSDIHLSIKELTLQIDTLNDEKVYLKKNHDEELLTTRSQLSGQIHVEVETAPQQDLTSILEDIRDHYETVSAKNRRELEGWFKGKLESLKQDVAAATQSAATSKTEFSSEKTKVQSLDVELQAVLAVKASLEAKLLEKQSFYSTQLSGYQLQVTTLEDQLLQLRADLERQGRDYETLLDIKTRLELEIADYRRLLEGASGIFLATTGKGSATSAATLTKAKEKVDEKAP